MKDIMAQNQHHRHSSTQQQAMGIPRNRILFVFFGVTALVFISRIFKPAYETDEAITKLVAQDTKISDLISFQAHSLNDLRTWHSMLQKGMDWIKVDFYFVEEDFSQEQQLVRRDFANQNSALKLDFLQLSNDINLSRFLLTHDKPYNAQFYFNSNDVLNYIVHSNYIHYFNNPHTRIYIALCFKLAFNPCIDSPSSKSWVQAVDEFYEKANVAITKHRLNVEFIMDQSGTPGGRGIHNRNCLAHKWPGWVSTYISHRDPLDAFFSNDDTYVDGMFAGNNLARFQILNEAAPAPSAGVPVTHFVEKAAQQHYGKFLKGNYPIVVWEPSNQKEIQQVIEVFSKYGLSNNYGFRFSINNDVPQFHIFGNLTKRAWNLRLAELEQHHNPHIITLPTKDGTSILVFTYGIDGIVCHNMYTSHILSSNLEIRQRYLLPEVSTNIKSVNTFPMEESHMIIIQDQYGTFYFYLYDEISLKFLRTVQRSAEHSATWKIFQSTVVRKDEMLFLAQLVSPDTCHLELELLHLQARLPKIDLTLTSRHCLGSFKSKDYSVVDSSLLLFDDGIKGLQGLVYFTALNRDQYAMFSNVIKLKSEKDGLFAVTSPASSSFLEDSFVWIGAAESIHISSAKYKDTHVIALVNDRGYCWYSILNNLKASPLLCDNFPDSTPTILNYSYGTLEQWIEFLNNNRKLEFGEDVFLHNFLTPCASLKDDSVLFHGVYDRGYSPRSSVVFSGDLVAMITAHRGLDPETASIDFLSCGEALPFDGIVLDAWKLPEIFQPAKEVSTGEHWPELWGVALFLATLIGAFWYSTRSVPKTIKPQ